MERKDPDFFVFDRYRLDARSGTLKASDGAPRKLRGKAQEVLLFLVRNHGERVTIEELLDNVWGVTSAEASVRNCIRSLRVILGKTRDGTEFIDTVSGGYKFGAPVVEERKEERDGPASLGDLVGTWVSDDFKFFGDVISATLTFERCGPLIAGSLLRTLSNKKALNIQGGIGDVEIKGEDVKFTVMMDVFGLHTSRQFPVVFAGVLSGDRLELAALYNGGPQRFTARKVSSHPNPVGRGAT
jgi:DNA-binding winged helix-turn-helix (wHTH) protein